MTGEGQSQIPGFPGENGNDGSSNGNNGDGSDKDPDKKTVECTDRLKGIRVFDSNEDFVNFYVKNLDYSNEEEDCIQLYEKEVTRKIKEEFPDKNEMLLAAKGLEQDLSNIKRRLSIVKEEGEKGEEAYQDQGHGRSPDEIKEELRELEEKVVGINHLIKLLNNLASDENVSS